MGRMLVLLILLGAAGALWLRAREHNPLEPRVDARTVVVTSGGIEGRFTRSLPFSGAFMIFGGVADESRTGFSNAHLAALDLSEAAGLMQAYPDFHRCASPGAARAKRMVFQLGAIAAEGAVRRTLHDALAQHEQAVAAAGDRICVELAGERLDFADARLVADGRALGKDLRRALAHTGFVYVTHAAPVPCRPGH